MGNDMTATDIDMIVEPNTTHDNYTVLKDMIKLNYEKTLKLQKSL